MHRPATGASRLLWRDWFPHFQCRRVTQGLGWHAGLVLVWPREWCPTPGHTCSALSLHQENGPWSGLIFERLFSTLLLDILLRGEEYMDSKRHFTVYTQIQRFSVHTGLSLVFSMVFSLFFFVFWCTTRCCVHLSFAEGMFEDQMCGAECLCT